MLIFHFLKTNAVLIVRGGYEPPLSTNFFSTIRTGHARRARDARLSFSKNGLSSRPEKSFNLGRRANVARSRAICCVNLRCVALLALRIRFAGQAQRKCKFKQRRLQKYRNLAQQRNAEFLSFLNPGIKFSPIRNRVSAPFRTRIPAHFTDPPPKPGGQNPA